jgi:hypothetical protein
VLGDPVPLDGEIKMKHKKAIIRTIHLLQELCYRDVTVLNLLGDILRYIDDEE